MQNFEVSASNTFVGNCVGNNNAVLLTGIPCATGLWVQTRGKPPGLTCTLGPNIKPVPAYVRTVHDGFEPVIYMGLHTLYGFKPLPAGLERFWPGFCGLGDTKKIKSWKTW